MSRMLVRQFGKRGIKPVSCLREGFVRRWLKWITSTTADAKGAAIAAWGAAIVSVASLSWTIYTDYEDNNRKAVARSIEEVDRIFDPQFAASLSAILQTAYVFLEDSSTSALRGKERFELFWQRAGDDGDVDMMIIDSRLFSIAECLKTGVCQKDEVFSRFPSPIYQALFFLREFLFLPPQLEIETRLDLPNGWWLGTDLYNFLAAYCEWHRQQVGTMPLWSPKHEKLRVEHGAPAPPPCLPKRL